MKKAFALLALLGLVSLVTAQNYTPVTAEFPGTVSGDATVSGALTVSGTETSSGLQVHTPTALTVTNDQVITVSAGTYVLTGTGQADNYTNTVTVANTTKGARVLFVVSASSSNLVTFADSGNLKLSGAALLDNNDTLELFAADTNVLVEVSQTDN